MRFAPSQPFPGRTGMENERSREKKDRKHKKEDEGEQQPAYHLFVRSPPVPRPSLLPRGPRRRRSALNLGKAHP